MQRPGLEQEEGTICLANSTPTGDNWCADPSPLIGDAVVIPPCSVHGVTLTIRKFNSRHFTIEDLVNGGSLALIGK